MSEPLSLGLGLSVRAAAVKHTLHQIVDELGERDSVMLIVAHRSDDDMESWVDTHRFAHLYEALGMLDYVQDNLRSEKAKDLE